MQKRKQHQKTEYETQRTAYRETSPRHVVQFEADMSEDQKRHSFAMANTARQLGNRVKGEMERRITQMERTKSYRKLKADYGYCVTRMGRVKESSEEYKRLEKRKAFIGKEMQAAQKKFGVTWDDTRKEMIHVSEEEDINSIFCLRAAEDAWQSIEKVLYSTGKRLHYRKRDDLPCLRAKQSDRGIPVKAKDGKLIFSVDGIGTFGIIIPGKDLFLQDEAAGIIRFLENPCVIEKAAVDTYAKDGIILDTFRPCYAALKCVKIRGKLRVYVQVTVEGRACPKKKNDGSPRHDFSKTGPVGCDIGTQSVAAVSKGGLLLDNLAERSHKSTKESESLERRLLRKMDRSRRAMNPDNYNEDGTVKPRSQREPWVYSKSYLKTREQHAEMARKNADSRKFANREMANRIRSMGDILITEPKNADKLKRKAKESKVTVREDGTKKYSRRKRFGKSIQNRCPGQFQEELKHKFGEAYYIVVPSKYRASQYDHTANQFIKKELNQRMYSLSDGTKVQRDLYSAYLLMHPDGEVKSPDYETCKSDFSTFKTKMDALVKEIKASGRKVCNSGI